MNRRGRNLTKNLEPKAGRKDRDALRILFALVFILLAAVASVDEDPMSEQPVQPRQVVKVRELKHRPVKSRETEPMLPFRLKSAIGALIAGLNAAPSK